MTADGLIEMLPPKHRFSPVTGIEEVLYDRHAWKKTCQDDISSRWLAVVFDKESAMTCCESEGWEDEDDDPEVPEALDHDGVVLLRSKETGRESGAGRKSSI